jgi:alkylation response protein AidB-like acyl-CoA dehydrogenase
MGWKERCTLQVNDGIELISMAGEPQTCLFGNWLADSEGHMDFSFTPEQIAYRSSVVKFARAELKGDLPSLDKNGEFDWDAFRKCAEFGIQGLSVPPEYGGSGADPLTVVLAMEALGSACKDNGLLFSINAQMWSVQAPILEFGTKEQKEKYLPPLCRGDQAAAHAMSEPESGSDAFSLRTTAEKRNGKYVLNGTKTFVTNASIAGLVLVFATLDRTQGMRGITAFLIEKDTPGLKISRKLDKMGLRTSPMGEVQLESCEIPECHRLGPEGAGVAVFNCGMEWERGAILASYLGTMERQLETCVKYARDRKQFGKPIGRFQAVAHRIAEMKVRLETSRWLVYHVAWRKQQSKKAVMEAAIAKLYLSECFVKSCLDAVQIHGGYGYMTEFGMERDLRDSISGTLYSGTSEIQRNIIAAWLGLPGVE